MIEHIVESIVQFTGTPTVGFTMINIFYPLALGATFIGIFTILYKLDIHPIAKIIYAVITAVLIAAGIYFLIP